MSEPVLEVLAVLVARELEARSGPRRPLVDVATVAAFLAVEPGWVYANAGELGARRLGDGPRARLRFDLAEVDRRLTVGIDSKVSPITEAASLRGPRPRRRRGSGKTPALLPVRGVDFGA